MNILAIRFSSIGDILLTTPLLRALRARHPDARIVMLTKSAFAPLLTENPRLDAVRTLGPEESLWAVARRLRAERFTHVLDLHGSLRSGALRLMVPARWSGYEHYRAERRRLLRDRRDTYPREIPVAERYFDAVRELGVAPDGGPPEFFLREEAAEQARRWRREAGIGAERAYVALAPGAAHATKRWPVEYYRSLAAELTGAGNDLVLVGGPEDREIAEQVAAAAGARAAVAAGRFDLQGTGALLRDARALVSGDTGMMHMATGVGTPVVALFGPTVRAFGFFPYQGRAVVLERDLECRPCSAHGGENCPLGHHRCLRDINPPEVRAALARVAP